MLLENELLGKEKRIQKQEEEVIKIKQRELQTVKQEFETHMKIYDQFDENPTPELCATFLQEAKEHL